MTPSASHVTFPSHLVLDPSSPTYQTDLAQAIEVAMNDTCPDLSDEESAHEMEAFLAEEFPEADPSV